VVESNGLVVFSKKPNYRNLVAEEKRTGNPSYVKLRGLTQFSQENKLVPYNHQKGCSGTEESLVMPGRFQGQ